MATLLICAGLLGMLVGGLTVLARRGATNGPGDRGDDTLLLFYAAQIADDLASSDRIDSCCDEAAFDSMNEFDDEYEPW